MARKIRRTRARAMTEQVEEQVVEEVTQPKVEPKERPAQKEEAEVKSTGDAVLDSADRIITKYRDRATSPLKAIRAKCVECMGGSIAEINRCTSSLCSLYPFRMGKNTLHALAKKEVEE